MNQEQSTNHEEIARLRKEIARLWGDLRYQARLAGEQQCRPLGVRRSPVNEALKYMDLYWDHENSSTGLNPRRWYLEQADACLRDALSLDPRKEDDDIPRK